MRSCSSALYLKWLVNTVAEIHHGATTTSNYSTLCQDFIYTKFGEKAFSQLYCFIKPYVEVLKHNLKT